MDYMATLADFAGLPLPSDRQLDSMSLRQALTNGSEVKRSSSLIYCTNQRF